MERAKALKAPWCFVAGHSSAIDYIGARECLWVVVCQRCGSLIEYGPALPKAEVGTD